MTKQKIYTILQCMKLHTVLHRQSPMDGQLSAQLSATYFCVWHSFATLSSHCNAFFLIFFFHTTPIVSSYQNAYPPPPPSAPQHPVAPGRLSDLGKDSCGVPAICKPHLLAKSNHLLRIIRVVPHIPYCVDEWLASARPPLHTSDIYG